MKKSNIVREDDPWGDHDWRAKYSILYSSRKLVSQFKDSSEIPISFLIKEETPYTRILANIHARQQDDSIWSKIFDMLPKPSEGDLKLELISSKESSDSQNTERALLDMVRARRCKRTIEDELVQTIKAPNESSDEDVESDKICVHNVSLRRTDRSISRSRFSRTSTRRDMDIPTILAYTTEFISPPQPTKELSAFEKPKDPPKEAAPRWSIRRSVCPVCSQKWRDRSSLKILRGSGLKRYSSLETPSVIAPARLRSAIKNLHAPRQILPAVDESRGTMSVMWKNVGSASWHLSRARRYNATKLQKQITQESIVMANTSLAYKDMGSRLNRFLSPKS